jgi:ABC-type sugar transport system ATPase subunit
MNLIRGALTLDDGEYRVEADGVRLALDRDWQPVLDRYGKRAVFLGIRPDHLSPWADGASAISAEVESVETLIGETLVLFRLPGGGQLAGIFAEAGDELAAGQAVQLAVGEGGIELFDPESERSLRAG